MDLRGWNECYFSGQRQAEHFDAGPSKLVTETVQPLPAGTALDLACGAGRNALWLAEQGWKVTAVDGAPAAIEILRRRAAERGVTVDARVADLEKGEYSIEPSAWNLILLCYYLQRDLFEPAKRGVVQGGIVIAIVHITEPGEEPTYKRARPGELRSWFEGWEILHYREGKPDDPAHQRAVAEIVARRGQT
ncbi:MAG: methyltransferase domain-containing protein [Acidobacteriia bacterium]|nr:methyltransferase domain-containing protein [Terriglobia bacterium]